MQRSPHFQAKNTFTSFLSKHWLESSIVIWIKEDFIIKTKDFWMLRQKILFVKYKYVFQRYDPQEMSSK